MRKKMMTLLVDPRSLLPYQDPLVTSLARQSCPYCLVQLTSHYPGAWPLSPSLVPRMSAARTVLATTAFED